MVGAIIALSALVPIASLAADGGNSTESAKQAGEDRWIPSLAITSGITIQNQKGSADSILYQDIDGLSPDPVPLRGFVNGDDLVVSPFVGGSFELMSPALPIPTRPRLFVSAEILPTFASDRDLAIEGDPGCVRGPEPKVRCARNEPTNEDGYPLRDLAFGEDSANGEGTRTSTKIDTLAVGANLGVAFPLKVGKRQIRIKPSVGWINYEVKADGFVVDAACEPEGRCTDVGTTMFILNPNPPPFVIGVPGPVKEGFLRETILSANASQRFNGIGPGLDIEMDTGRFGPLGVSLYIGGRAYAIVDDRTISFGASRTFTDQVSDPGADPPVKTDRATAQFEVKVDPWIYRAHLGIRFYWLGNQE
jgi:hypothetical protein